MAASELALFRAWPKLREQLPHHPFIDAPTPVEPLRLADLPAVSLYVKRDDHVCRLYGGNKPRKLEFLIGHALARGATRLLTTGGLGSHHALATTILGAAAGLDSSLVLVPQPLTAEVHETLALDAAFGAEIVRTGSVAEAVLQTARLLLRSRLRGEQVQRIPTGGSGALGNLGFVSAGLELAEQISAGASPLPAEIQLPVGTGGTLAGLVLGLKLAGLEIPVRGALVTDILPPSPARLVLAARSSLRLLRRLEPAIPAPVLHRRDFVFDRSELGPGYGAATPSARAARAQAAEAGLSLETTYGAKCLAALLARARRGELRRGPVLFWNTHNAVRLRAPAGQLRAVS